MTKFAVYYLFLQYVDMYFGYFIIKNQIDLRIARPSH
jgi:hypothetical protein